MSAGSEMDAVLEEFRRRFVLRAAGDAERLSGLLAGLKGPADPALGEIRKLAHGLAGTGGTFGFPEVSSAAETVETAAMATPPDLATLRQASLHLVSVLRGVL